MKRCIKEFNDTGICKIDVEKAIKYWNNNVSISQWNDEYTLIETTPSSRKYKLKAKISKDNAQEIISKMQLYEHKSTIFRNASTWKW